MTIFATRDWQMTDSLSGRFISGFEKLKIDFSTKKRYFSNA